MKIRVKYFGGMKNHRLNQISIGDYIDVRVDRVYINGEKIDWDKDNKVKYKSGDEIKAYLGVAMELPEGFEAMVVPRGSTFKNFGVIQVNSPGIIDNSYCGDNDEWFIPFFCLKDGVMERFDRVAQFRVIKSMGDIRVFEVEKLNNKDRGGHGSTGVR